MNATEIINLYDIKVNEPKRKKVLDGILNHSSGHLLAKCVFERIESSDFLAVRNLLMPKNEGDEYGPYDSILEPGYCQSILRSLGSTDYVINLLRDEFKRKYERDVDSLSDIARIVTEREEIKNETAVPKVILEMDAYYPTVKIGSEWIISDTMINGWEACNRYDEPQTDGLELYVYRISRSNGILLKQIHLQLSFIGEPSLLFEPFLIMFDGNDIFEVHNLLEPKKAPMTIKRSEYIIDVDFGFWAGSKYESDILPNGKLPESILFPVIYQPNDTRFCFDCVEIQQSEIKTLWTRTFEYSDIIAPDVIFIDRDNIIVSTEPIIHEIEIIHVILSKEKITKYTLKDTIGHYLSFGLFEEKIFVYGSIQNPTDNPEEYTFGYLTLSEEEMNFKHVCAFVKEETTGLKKRLVIGFDTEEILYFTHLSLEGSKIKRISIRRLLDFIKDENQKKLNLEREIDGKQVTIPIVDLSQFESSQSQAQKDFELIDRSNIGRASRNKIEMFI